MADFACLTVNPVDPKGARIEVLFPGDLTLRYFKYAPTRYMNLIAAKFVLEHPQRIFFGVREYNEGGWCYTGTPADWYVTADRREPFSKDLVFAVYLNPNFRVYECRAEYAAPDDPKCPVDWKDRYRGISWKNTS